jgi:hypothetical protein
MLIAKALTSEQRECRSASLSRHAGKAESDFAAYARHPYSLHPGITLRK